MWHRNETKFEHFTCWFADAVSTGASRGGGRLRGRVSIVKDDWETKGTCSQTSATPTLPPQLRMVTLKGSSMGRLGWVLLTLPALLSQISVPAAAQKPPGLSVGVILGQTRPISDQDIIPVRRNDDPVELTVTILRINQTDPKTVITQVCELLQKKPLHGLVFADGSDQEAISQILDFLSSQTSLPVLGVYGGSSMIMADKSVCENGSSRGLPRIVQRALFIRIEVSIVSPKAEFLQVIYDRHKMANFTPLPPLREREREL